VCRQKRKKRRTTDLRQDLLKVRKSTDVEVASETRTTPNAGIRSPMFHPKSQAEDRAAQVSQEGTVADRFLTAWKQLQAEISSRWRDAN